MLNRFYLSIRVKMMIALGLVIIFLLGSTFYWVAEYQEAQTLHQVHTRAQSLYKTVALTRDWMVAKGGIYIQKQGQVTANPYLLQVLGKERVEFEGVDGQTYILHNPELVTRQLADLAQADGENFVFRITSLNPLNPHNAPTDWEAAALRAFELGQSEATVISTENDTETYRYMVPLVVTENCLMCHAQQGYKIGDIRGGISVSVPMTEAREAINTTRWQLLLAGLGTTGGVFLILFVVVDRLVLSPLKKMEETVSKISLGQRDEHVPVHSIVHANDELGSLAQAFNQMTDQLQLALVNSEKLVKERTKRLRMVATLSGHLNSILDFDQLLTEIVAQIKETLGYYHAHIYLFDDSRENLVVAVGSGRPEIEKPARGYQVPLNVSHSIVARAARTKEIIIVDDVRQLPDWQPNPLWPESYAKIAVPIIVEGQVAGVLMVHENKVAGLDEGDASLLRSLANQMAVALNNARLFERIQNTLAEIEKLYHISQRVMMARNLQEIVAAVVEGMAIPVIHRALLLVSDYNAESKIEALILKASWYSGAGKPPKPLGTRYTWAMSTVVNMAITPEPLFFDDVQQDDRVDADTLAGAKQRNVRAMVVLPLYSQGRQLGVLMLLGEERYHFTRQEVRPYYSLLAQLAVAVENQHLLAQAQQRTAELEEAHSFLSSIIENIPSMLFVKDAQNQFVRWNQAAEQLIGLDRAKILGQEHYNFLSPDQSTSWLKQDQQVLADGQGIESAEETIETISQGVRLLHTRKVPILSSDGKPKYLLGISEDITERRQAERDLKQANEELTKLNANKDKFLSIMAHDLRAPFSPLLGMSEFLVEIADRGNPYEVREISESINRAARSVYNLLENLLEWSRIQRGHITYDPVTFNLKQIAQGNIELLTATAKDKGIQLRSLISHPWFIYADEQMIDTVIRNLISNALKFTPAGGQVTVSARLANQSPTNKPTLLPAYGDSQPPIYLSNMIDFVEISVSDTGIGISSENLRKLFNITSNHTTLGTAQEKGTGLGLIICQEMVEKNGGEIWIESDVGQGTTVKFTVPLDNSVTSDLPRLKDEADSTTNHTAELTANDYSATELLIPPAEDMVILLDLARSGDLMGITAKATALEEANHKLRPFSDKLRQLAEEFEEEEVQLFIKQSMKHHVNPTDDY